MEEVSEILEISEIFKSEILEISLRKSVYSRSKGQAYEVKPHGAHSSVIRKKLKLTVFMENDIRKASLVGDQDSV
jgi:hypothetical protein